MKRKMVKAMKIIGLVMLGVSLTLTAELTWASKYNFFLVHKTEAAYLRMAAYPVNEFEGMESEVYKKYQTKGE